MPIRAIREACRRFHDDAVVDYLRRGFSDRRGDRSAGIFLALGALRAIIGQQVASLAAHYDLDLEGDLATVLPQIDDDQE